eukprot:365360-Chlamydomonas_euryale.AAC.3
MRLSRALGRCTRNRHVDERAAAHRDGILQRNGIGVCLVDGQLLGRDLAALCAGALKWIWLFGRQTGACPGLPYSSSNHAL